MIESRIKVLRKAAQVSTAQSSDRLWCVIAGNEEMVNSVAYEAITSRDLVKILFREHVTIKDSFLRKRFDLIMLHGESNKIRDLSLICKEKGGAYIKIAPYYVENEPNLVLLVAPENYMKRFAGEAEKNKIGFSFILEDRTSGFIETDVYLTERLPAFIRNIIDPLFKVTDVVLVTLLISVHEAGDVERINEIASRNNIFAVDFRDIFKEE
ncbi:hypothetical protein [Methanothermobacter sp.]|uniref:hypothetical protein n=1 Tax=Methanothermobacter sp. TaxID=1884223 RepID=UPI0026227255|nr:hypothetical protein [Methanothermobacter sp.]